MSRKSDLQNAPTKEMNQTQHVPFAEQKKVTQSTLWYAK